MEQIEKIQRLFRNCGDKYVRVDICRKGLINKKVFMCNPNIVKITRKAYSIKSDDCIIITTIGYSTLPFLYPDYYDVNWKGKEVVKLDHNVRVYSTYYSMKGIRRLINNMFNYKLKRQKKNE